MYTKYEYRIAKNTDVWTIRLLELVDSQNLFDTKAFKQFVWEATCWCTFETLDRDATQRSSNNLSSCGHYNLPLSVGLWQLWELFILLALGQKKCNASYWSCKFCDPSLFFPLCNVNWNKVITRWEGPQSLSYRKQSLSNEQRWATVCRFMFDKSNFNKQSVICTQEELAPRFGTAVCMTHIPALTPACTQICSHTSQKKKKQINSITVTHTPQSQ